LSTTITGTIRNIATATVGSSSNSFVRFVLRGTGGNQPRVTGSASIAPLQGGAGLFYSDIFADASGNVSGTVYSTRDAAGTGNGEIELGGSYTAAYFDMYVYANGIPGPAIPVHTKNAATLDISNVTPITTTPVVTAPTGDSTYARLDAGNMPFTGNISFASTPATAGTIRFPSVGSMQWRNNANSGNFSLSKTTDDVFHIPMATQWDCGSTGQVSCSGGAAQLVLNDNNNPGIDGNGHFIRWGAYTSTGVGKNPTQLQGGFASATNGSEQATLDIINYVGGTVRGLAIGGVVGGGTVPAITPGDAGIWQLGRSGSGFIKARMEGSNPSTEYRNTAATLPNGLHRILETGNDFIINRNTAAGGDFSTNTNDLILRGVDGKIQIGTGIYTDGGGFKHATASTGSIGATTRAEIQITWGTAWADTSYTAVCSVEESSATLQTLLLERIRQKTTTIVTAIIFNPTAGGLTGTLDCIGIHQ
jgi:hypothetical protein